MAQLAHKALNCRRGRTDLEIIIDEILQEKITPDFSESGYEPPTD